MAKLAIKFIQISDTHLFENSKDELLGVNTEESLKAVIESIKLDLDGVSFILHTGDLSQDRTEKSYHKLANLLEVLQRPVYCIPGNHDDELLMNNVYPFHLMRFEKYLTINTWQLILLSSHKRECVEGYLAETELKRLETALKENPNLHTMIVLHHQPVNVGSNWLDNLGLKNTEDLWRTISSYPNVKVILFGHVHQESEHFVNGIKLYSAPSTCIQFMRQQHHFGIENIPQGYRIVSLFDDGDIVTEVKRLSRYVGKFDENAKGY